MPGHFGNQFRALGGGRVNCHLIGPVAKDCTNVSNATNSSSNGDWYKHVFGCSRYDFGEIVPAIKTGYGIHVYYFVDVVLIIPARKFLGVTHNAQTLKVDTLDQVFPFDIEPGDETDVCQKPYLALGKRLHAIF